MFEFRQLFANGFAKKKRCQLSFVMFPLFEAAADQGKNLESSLWSWISTISAAAECFRTFKILDFNGVENFCNLYIQPDIPQTVVKDLKSLHKYKHRKNCESCPNHSSVKEPFSPGRAAAGGRPSLAPGEEWLLRISPPQNGGIGGTMAL